MRRVKGKAIEKGYSPPHPRTSGERRELIIYLGKNKKQHLLRDRFPHAAKQVGFVYLSCTDATVQAARFWPIRRLHSLRLVTPV